MTEAPKHKFLLKRDTKTEPNHILSAPHHAVSLPVKIDLRYKMPAVYDQNEIGSCTANALGCALQYNQLSGKTVKVRGAKPHAPFMPSRLFIYYNERALAHNITEDAGASLEDGVKSLKDKGVCPETLWPYDISQFAVKPPKAAFKTALETQVLNYKKIPHTLIQLKTALMQGYPVSFGMAVFDSFNSEAVAKTGIVPMPQPQETNLGGHAILLVGYDDAQNRFIVRNSWGADWGDHGYFYLLYEYILNQEWCSDFWVLLNVEA